jgi:hypothetical protein
MILSIMHLVYFPKSAPADDFEPDKMVRAERAAIEAPQDGFRSGKLRLQRFLFFLRYVLLLEMRMELAMPQMAFAAVPNHSLEMFDKM